MEVSTDSTVQTSNMYNFLNTYSYTPTAYGVNVSAILIIIIIVVAFISIFAALGKTTGIGSGSGSSSNYNNFNITSEYSGDDGYKKGTSAIGLGIFGLFIIIIFFSGLNYFYGSTIKASLSKIISPTPTIDVAVAPTTNVDNTPTATTAPITLAPSIIGLPQVFNIPGNYFGYEDAKTLCTAYGSRLAKYDEVEKAYGNGAEWCSYGWSDGQMALFPTQQSTYANLQQIKGHEHDCGRPGVNGGYMANPHAKFGVNCFGVKPKITEQEEELMAVSTPYPKTRKDILMEERVEYWKKHLNQILVSPFNYDSWSRF